MGLTSKGETGCITPNVGSSVFDDQGQAESLCCFAFDHFLFLSESPNLMEV